MLDDPRPRDDPTDEQLKQDRYDGVFVTCFLATPLVAAFIAWLLSR